CDRADLLRRDLRAHRLRRRAPVRPPAAAHRPRDTAFGLRSAPAAPPRAQGAARPSPRLRLLTWRTGVSPWERVHQPEGMDPSRSALALASALVATLALTACSGPTQGAGYEIEAVACDPAASARRADRAFSPLGGETFAVTGWSHASPAETLLALDPAAYGLRRASFAPDDGFGGQNAR